MKNIIKNLKKVLKATLFSVISTRDFLIAFFFGLTIKQLLPNARFSKTSDCYKNIPRIKIMQEELLILIICKDVARFLPVLENNLEKLTYPKNKITIGILEGDSSDETYPLLKKINERLQNSFKRVELYKKDFGSIANRGSDRWKVGSQSQRRSRIAKARNHLLSLTLKERHQWVLWIDADVKSWEQDIIQQLLSFNKCVIAPHCVGEDKRTFDLNSFKYKQSEKKNWRSYIKDGLLQPPRGFGRSYLSDLQEYDLVSLDAVGGTMLLVKGDLHRAGLIYPEDERHLHIETEALAFMVRELGEECWGAPKITIVHPIY